ncbi:MAG: peptidoglycan-N-acetylmuramate O-acetyltransferase [Acidimicrobiales bacterium]|nr:peptidoglycan-N-acetylmuramate O-acetyltransferase [Acidimicrobiales bacterium]
MTPPPATTATRPHAAAPTRIPALDGIRAFAVVGVLLYHAGISWMSGGYLGVDVFFVLSGFLVTLLLVGEHERSGGVELKRFWTRRVRRLLPAQLALLATVTVVTAVFYREDLFDLRGQVVAALTASTNWYLRATGGSYFANLGRPPVLRHLWSLAIEMQFYVVWPLLFVGLMRLWRGKIERLVVTLLLAALASAALMAYLYQPPPADLSRVYYNTFCRLTGLLLGAALALLWRPSALVRGPVARRGPLLDLVGVVGLGVIVAFMVLATDQSAAMYRGGFALLSIATALVVAAAAHPGARLSGSWGLGHPALVAVGVRSYGLYLWHWPIYALTRPGVDLPWSSGPTLALRLLLTVVVNELSFRWVERPWHERRVTLASILPSRRRFVAWPRPAQAVALGTVLAIAVGSASLATAPKASNAIVASIKSGEDEIAAHNRRAATTAAPTTTAPPTTTTSRAAGSTTTAPSTTTTTTAVPPPPIGAIPRVTAVGDSVMVGAASGLYRRFGDKIYIDARVSRQGSVAPGIIASIKAQRGLGDVVLIHLGTNGPLKVPDLRAMVDAAAPTPVVFLTVRENRSWEGDVNNTLLTVVPTLGHARVIDWHALADPHDDWFHSDSVHMTKPGIEAYADFVLRALIRSK